MDKLEGTKRDGMSKSRHLIQTLLRKFVKDKLLGLV